MRRRSRVRAGASVRRCPPTSSARAAARGASGRARSRRATLPIDPTRSGRRLEDVLATVVPSGREPVASKTPKSGTKNEPRSKRNDSYERRLIVSAPSVAAAEDEHDQDALWNAGQDVLHRHRGRIHVREGLVRLIDGDREQCQGRRQFPGRDHARQGDGIGDVAIEDEQCPQRQGPTSRPEKPSPEPIAPARPLRENRV